MGLGVCMHKCVMHFLGHNCLNNHIHVTIFLPNFLSVIKLHVFTSRDENSVGPDQVGSWLIRICSVLKKIQAQHGSSKHSSIVMYSRFKRIIVKKNIN